MIYFPDNPLEPWAMLVVAVAWAFVWAKRNGPDAGALVIAGTAAISWPFALAGLMVFCIWETNERQRKETAELLAEIERRMK